MPRYLLVSTYGQDLCPETGRLTLPVTRVKSFDSEKEALQEYTLLKKIDSNAPTWKIEEFEIDNLPCYYCVEKFSPNKAMVVVRSVHVIE